MGCANSPLEVAQTNLQLYRQMEARGYAAHEVAAVNAAYFGALPWFSAQYRGSGKPFISHLVGTASILVSRRAPVSHVLAGLLHAAYQAGDLGVDPGWRETPARRRVLRNLVGAEAEELVLRYELTDWGAMLEAGARQEPDRMDAVLRGATYVFLANTLEDFLDGGMCPLAGTRKGLAWGVDAQAGVSALARAFAWPELALAMQPEFERFNAARSGDSARPGSGYSGLVLPPSAKRRLLPAALSFIARARRWLGRRLAR